MKRIIRAMRVKSTTVCKYFRGGGFRLTTDFWSLFTEMAARRDPRNRDSSNKLASATQLLNRLIKHGNGELDMSMSQINAAKIVIGKYIPDLKAVEHRGDPDNPISVINRIERVIVYPKD